MEHTTEQTPTLTVPQVTEQDPSITEQPLFAEGAEQALQKTADAEPPAVTETQRMKSAYSRGGLGLGTLYLIFQQIGSIFLVIGAVIGTLLLVLPHLAESGAMGKDPVGFVGGLFQNSSVLAWVIALHVVGMAVGMTVGLLVMRKILTERVPLEKRSLSIGKFLGIVLISYGIWAVGALLGNFPSFFNVSGPGGLEELLKGLKGQAWPIYLYVCIGAPVFEELACRKLLLDRLHPYGEGFAMVVTALLFGLIHGNSGQFFLAFFLGLLFAMVYLRTGKIAYTMLLHGIINTTASLPELFGLFGVDIELVWYIAVGVLAVAGLVLLVLWRNDALLRPGKSFVPEADRVTWRNVGMVLMRVAGLITLVSQDLLMTALAFLGLGLGSGGKISVQPLALLKLIPMALALVLVLVLPAWARRFAKKEEIPDGDHEDAVA